jgi:hypothetical protein
MKRRVLAVLNQRGTDTFGEQGIGTSLRIVRPLYFIKILFLRSFLDRVVFKIKHRVLAVLNQRGTDIFGEQGIGTS